MKLLLMMIRALVQIKLYTAAAESVSAPRCVSQLLLRETKWILAVSYKYQTKKEFSFFFSFAPLNWIAIFSVTLGTIAANAIGQRPLLPERYEENDSITGAAAAAYRSGVNLHSLLLFFAVVVFEAAIRRRGENRHSETCRKALVKRHWAINKQ